MGRLIYITCQNLFSSLLTDSTMCEFWLLFFLFLNCRFTNSFCNLSLAWVVCGVLWWKCYQILQICMTHFSTFFTTLPCVLWYLCHFPYFGLCFFYLGYLNFVDCLVRINLSSAPKSETHFSLPFLENYLFAALFLLFCYSHFYLLLETEHLLFH